jgi:hypothetical protein
MPFCGPALRLRKGRVLGRIVHFPRSLLPIGPEQLQALTLEGPGWKMEIKPYDGAIVKWRLEHSWTEY